MLRKSFLLTIIFLTLGPAFVSAQDEAAVRRIQEEGTQKIGRIVEDFKAGKISSQEYSKRLAEANQEMMTALQAEMQKARDSSPTYTSAQLRRLEELYEQRKLIEARLNEGRISPAECEKQYVPVTTEIERITKPLVDSLPAREQLQGIMTGMAERWPGSFAGWPQADGETGYRTVTGIGPFRQGAGTRASYGYFRQFGTGTFIGYTIYQTGATAQTLADLKQQIEALTGKPMAARSNGAYNAWVPRANDGGYVSGWDIDLKLNGGQLKLDMAWAHEWER